MPTARQLGTVLHVSSTFTVEGRYLLLGDRVLFDGALGTGLVRTFVPTRLVLDFPDQQIECRPWQEGDAALPRCAEAHSNWTVHEASPAVQSITVAVA